MMTESARTATARRVLVVEDEYFVAKGLAADLRAAGFEVLGPAPSVVDALALIEPGQVDGASLDVSLRGELVYPVADVLADKGVPFVFVTGFDADVLPERFAGSARLLKPVETGNIVRALFPLQET